MGGSPRCRLLAGRPGVAAGKPTAAESALWKRLWHLPVAASWHEQRIEPTIVATYVRLALKKPEHASVLRLISELG